MKACECDKEDSIVFIELKTYRHCEKIANSVHRILRVPANAQAMGGDTART